MGIQVECACGKRLYAQDGQAGRKVRCPACQEPVKVPAMSLTETHPQTHDANAMAEPTDQPQGAGKALLLGGGAIIGVLVCCVLAVGYFVWFRDPTPRVVNQTTSGEPPAQAMNPAARNGPPSITATPNPVPAGDSKFGTTTVAWDTGDGSPGEVYVIINGKEERRFSGSPRGNQDASWIGKGEYEFRLYAGKERKSILASVKVVRKAS